MTTEIGRVKCWSSTEGLRQKEVLERETGMVYNVKTTTTTTNNYRRVTLDFSYRKPAHHARGETGSFLRKKTLLEMFETPDLRPTKASCAALGGSVNRRRGTRTSLCTVDNVV